MITQQRCIRRCIRRNRSPTTPRVKHLYYGPASYRPPIELLEIDAPALDQVTVAHVVLRELPTAIATLIFPMEVFLLDVPPQMYDGNHFRTAFPLAPYPSYVYVHIEICDMFTEMAIKLAAEYLISTATGVVHPATLMETALRRSCDV